MQKITLKQLEMFVAVAECSSFTLAAERLYTTQSTVSMQIAALENALGTAVLRRENRKKVTLTPAGETVFAYAKEILGRCGEMERAVQPKGPDKLLIGASSIPSQWILPDMMAGFMRRRPDGAFAVRKGDSTAVHDMLRSKTVRIGFAGSALDEENMNYIPLMQDTLVVITPCTSRFLAMQQAGISGESLLSEPILLREADSGSRKEFERFLHRQGIATASLRVVAEIDQPSTIIESVAKGVGVSVISSLAAQQAVEEGKLLTFPLGGGLTRYIYLVTVKDFVPVGIEREFIEYVCQTMKS